MSRTSAILKNQYEKHFKHQRQEYKVMRGTVIEIGWKGVFEHFFDWIRGRV